MREVVRPGEFTPLPGLPIPLRGLVNVRSRLVPAFDLRTLLHLRPRPDPAVRETMLIASWEGAEFGILADALVGMRRVPSAELRPEVTALETRFLRGITADGMLLLDPSALAGALTLADVPPQP